MAERSKHSSVNGKAVTEAAKLDPEQQEWFHGFRPRKDIQLLLKEPNQFLMRVSDTNGNGCGEIIVSVMGETKDIYHLTLVHDGGLWKFSLVKNRARKSHRSDATHRTKSQVNGFPTVVELVTFYGSHKTPGKAYLKSPVLRPSWAITHDKVQYKTSDLLGSGNFCHVYKGKYTRAEGHVFEVAVKVCHEGKLATETSGESEESKEARKSMISEAQLMSNYLDDFIIRLHGVALAHSPILIVIEFCAGGNLEKHLTSGKEIEPGERVIYALEAAKGMRYLHDEKCVHRDLAARNCLISSKGTIKISDFGLSLKSGEVDKGKDDAEPEVSPQIPLRWMAPESLKKPIGYSAKSDVWSFGVLLYEIFNNGVKPWPNDPGKKIATMIRKCQMPPFPEKAPKEIKEIVKTIWVEKPDDRPSMNKLYRQLWATRKVVLPPADLANWAINKIAGVKREKTDMIPNLEVSDADGRSNEATTNSLPTTEATGHSEVHSQEQKKK